VLLAVAVFVTVAVLVTTGLLVGLPAAGGEGGEEVAVGLLEAGVGVAALANSTVKIGENSESSKLAITNRL
jgi:hypothetical protein